MNEGDENANSERVNQRRDARKLKRAQKQFERTRKRRGTNGSAAIAYFAIRDRKAD